MLAGAKGEADEATARRILEYKTGRYSVQRPLHLGAAVAGNHAALEAALTAYGRPVGVAFQLRDDILGAFGDTEVTGKPVGDDLREGKPTPLLATARRLASDSEARVLARAGDLAMTESELTELQDVVRATGAVDVIETEIAQLTDEAMRAVDAMTLAGGAAEAFRALATFVAYRTH